MRFAAILHAAAVVTAFVPRAPVSRRQRALLRAGPPQYDKHDGTLSSARDGRGNTLVSVTGAANSYAPGHVLALEIEDAAGEWQRGPYTVTRATPTSFDVLLRVVGEKSKLFEAASPGTAVKYGGQFHVPVLEGVYDGAARLVLVSTGVGVGPCLGAIEGALQYAGPRLCLLSGYREAEDVCAAAHLDALAGASEGRFSWTTALSSVDGRVSAPQHLEALAADADAADTHYHLVGNGAMVKEWQAGLELAGVAAERVTVETYFNHAAEPDAAVVARIGAALREAV